MSGRLIPENFDETTSNFRREPGRADEEEDTSENWDETDTFVSESETDDSVFRLSVNNNDFIPPPPLAPPPLPPPPPLPEELHEEKDNKRLKEWLETVAQDTPRNLAKNNSLPLLSSERQKAIRRVIVEEDNNASDGSVFESFRGSLRSSCSSASGSSKKRVSFKGVSEDVQIEAGTHSGDSPAKHRRSLSDSSSRRSILKTPTISIVQEEIEDEAEETTRHEVEERLDNNSGGVSLDSINPSTPALSDGSEMRKMFFHTVRSQSVYEQLKRSKRCSWKNILRKGAGIPFALIYYFMIVWIVSSFILDTPHHPHEDTFLNLTGAVRNICDTVILTKGMNSSIPLRESFKKKYRAKILSTTSTDKKLQNSRKNSSRLQAKNIHILFENDFFELHIVTGGVMSAIGITSIFSRNTRATMLLLLPGLITNRSRHFIYTIILGMLVKYPLANLRENFNKLMDNSICLYTSVVAFGCVKQTEGNLILSYARNIFQSFVKLLEITKRMHCSFTGKSRCPKSTHDPFPYSDNVIDDIRTLSGPSTRGIKAQGTVLVNKANAMKWYFEIARKTFTVLSLLLLITDAIRYLRSYYTDSSFDNMHVCRTSRAYWEINRYFQDSEVLKKHPFAVWDDSKGLRRWELNDGYKTFLLPYCSLRLLYKVSRNCISLFMFIIFVSLVLLTDHLLAATLHYIRENEQFHINLPGFQRNITNQIQAELPKFNTRTCLAVPYETPSDVIVSIVLLLIVAAFSCLLQVLLSGIRAKLCAFFFPDRVKERADYLYFRIITGRINRKGDLLMLVRREVERREKLTNFSPLQRLHKFFYSLTGMKMVKVACPGCSRRVKEGKMKDLSLELVGKRKGTKICVDCELDLSSKYKSSPLISSS